MGRLQTWWTTRKRTTKRFLMGIGLLALIASLYQGGHFLYSEYHYQEALKALEKNRFTEARSYLDICLAERPNSAEISFLAARTARRDNDLATARKLLKRSEELGWPMEAVNMEYRLLNAQSGSSNFVQQDLLEWIRSAPDHSEADLIREVLIPICISRFEMDTAYELLQPWIEREPNKLQLRLWMFDVNRRLEIPQLAIDHARKAVEIDPESEQARRRCAEILIENYQAAEAKPHFDWLVQHVPKETSYKVGLAKCLRDLGEDQEAVRVLDGLLKEEPNRVSFLAERGMVDLHAGRPKEALVYFSKAIEQSPFELELMYNYSVCLEQNGKSEEAKIWRERHNKALTDLAELRATTKAISKSPRDAELRYKAGTILMRNGQEAEAVRWLQSALVENPNHQPSRQALTDYYQKRGQGSVNHK